MNKGRPAGFRHTDATKAKIGAANSRDPEMRFLAKVRKAGDCWLWQANIHTDTGYAYFWYEGKSVRAHRWAYEHWVGPIPQGLTLDHTCRRRTCVSPKHSEPVTLRTNILRGEGGAARNARKTRCPTCDGPYSIRNSRQRICIPCTARYHRERRA